MQNRRIPHENEIFCFFNCKLTIVKICKLCGVSQKAVEGWFEGKPIPDYYKRLMQVYSCNDLSHIGWENWKFERGQLVTPLGYKINPEQIEYWYIMNSPETKKHESELQKLRKNKRYMRQKGL